MKPAPVIAKAVQQSRHSRPLVTPAEAGGQPAAPRAFPNFGQVLPSLGNAEAVVTWVPAFAGATWEIPGALHGDGASRPL